MNSNHFYFLFCAAIAPVLAGLGYIVAKDKYHKEPFNMLCVSFFLGIFSMFPIGIIEDSLLSIFVLFNPQPSPLLFAFWNAFVVAAFTEECTKLYILHRYIWKSPEFDERFDGIVYGVFISMGYACAENIMYVFLCLSQVGIFSAYETSIIRAIFSIPCHFFCGVILGYYLSLAKFEKENKKNAVVRQNTIFKGLLYSILFHGLFDFILFYNIASQLKMGEEAANGASGMGMPAIVLFILFIIINIQFWKFGKKRINHLASLLREKTADELPALVTCPRCGKTYTTDLTSCPGCNQSTEELILAQKEADNELKNQERQKLDDFFSNLDENNSPKKPFDV